MLCHCNCSTNPLHSTPSTIVCWSEDCKLCSSSKELLPLGSLLISLIDLSMCACLMRCLIAFSSVGLSAKSLFGAFTFSSFYTSEIFQKAEAHFPHFHAYADCNHLHLYFHPGADQMHALGAIKRCIY